MNMELNYIKKNKALISQNSSSNLYFYNNVLHNNAYKFRDFHN